MFNGDSALVGGKSVRLKTKMVKALRRSLGSAFPRLLAPIGSSPLMDKDEPIEETKSALDILVPVKSAINRVTFKDKTCLFKVCYDKKVKDSSSVFVPMFLELKRNHELIPTVFALWRVPDLLRISFITIPPVSSKLIKPTPADLFFPGVLASHCSKGDEWEQGELCSLFVDRNPFAFAVGRTGQTSYAAAAVAHKGVAAVVVHSYLDKIWQMERFHPAGFQETVVVPCLAPEPLPEGEPEVGAGDGEESDTAEKTTEATAPSAATTSTPHSDTDITSAPHNDTDTTPAPHNDTDVTPPPVPVEESDSTAQPEPETAADSTTHATNGDADALAKDCPATPGVTGPDTDGTAVPQTDDNTEATGATTETTGDAAEEEEETMDDLMLCTLFQALQKVPKAELPLLANIFMGKYFLPSRPANTILKVKQSTWGQFGKFLEAMSHVGVLQLTKQGAKGVMAIAAINPDSLEDHDPHVDQANEDARQQQQLQSGNLGSLFGASANNASDGGKLNIVQLYRPPDHAAALFTTVLERQKVGGW